MVTVQQKNFNRSTVVIEIYFMFMILDKKHNVHDTAVTLTITLGLQCSMQ